MKVRLTVRIRKFFDRFRVRISTGIAISLLLHAILLSLRLGWPGIGLPGLVMPWDEPNKQPIELKVDIAMSGSPPASAKPKERINPLEPKPLEALPSETKPNDLPTARVKRSPVKSAAKATRTAKALQSTPALARAQRKQGSSPQDDQSAPTPAYAQQELIAVNGDHPDSFKVPPPDPDNLLRVEEHADSTPVPPQPQAQAPAPAIAMQTPKQTIDQAQAPTPALQKPSDEQSYQKPEEHKATDPAPNDNADVTMEAGEHKPGDEIAEQEKENKKTDQEAAQRAADDETRKLEEARKADELVKQEAAKKLAREQAAQQAEEDAAKKREAAKKAEADTEEKRVAKEAEAKKKTEELAKKQAADVARKQEERNEAARKEEQRKQDLAQKQAEKQAEKQAKAQADAERKAEEVAKQKETQRKAEELEQKKKADEAERKQVAAQEKQKRADDLARDKAAAAAEKQRQQDVAAQQKADAQAAKQKADAEAEGQREAARVAAAGKNTAGNNPDGTGTGAGGKGSNQGNGLGNGTGKGSGDRGNGNQTSPGNTGDLAAKALRDIGRMNFDPPAGDTNREIADNRPRSAFGLDHDPNEDQYKRDWCTKIEQNENFNYSQRVKDLVREDPILTVTLRSDGKLLNVVINRSSGNSEIDKAARSIATLRGSFIKFPDEIASRVDTLEIRRVWSFGEKLTLHEEVH